MCLLKIKTYKIKKILRKIYHFIGFMSLFFLLIIPVHADVTTCDSFLISESLSFDIFGNFTYFDLGSDNYSIPIPQGSVSGTPVYLKFFTSDFPFDPTNSSSNLYKIQAMSRNTTTVPANGGGSLYSGYYSYDTSTNVWSFKTMQKYDSSNRYFSLTFPNNTVDPSALVGTPLALSYNLSDIENCELVPDTPPTPPTPPTPQIFSSFVTLFLDKLSFLATSFTTNPILFTFSSILFAWVILELFFKFFRLKGGRRK